MKTFAIITARSGSKSIKNKNLINVLNKKLIEYPINIAKKTKSISEIFVDTDGEDIAKVAKKNNCKVLMRPRNLRGDSISHTEVIRNSINTIEDNFQKFDIAVVMLGNALMFDNKFIEKAIKFLKQKKTYDSVMSVWEAGDDHPFRALKIKNKKLHSFFNLKNISTNRQSYPKAYFYDQSPWIFRTKNIKFTNGPGPWNWMGKKSYPIVRKWVTGRDIHSHFDLEISKFWVKNKTKMKKLS